MFYVIWNYSIAHCLVCKSVQEMHDLILTVVDRGLVTGWQKQKLPQSLQYISCLPQKIISRKNQTPCLCQIQTEVSEGVFPETCFFSKRDPIVSPHSL